MSNQRLHPLAILVYLFTSFKSAVFPIIIILFNTLDEGLLITAGVLSIGIVLLTLLAWLRYWFFSYDITPDALVIHSGVFVKKHNHIPYARMQTVHHQQWFFLKSFQLETLKIETAGQQNDEAEADLTVVPLAVGEMIASRRQGVTDMTLSGPQESEISDATIESFAARYAISTRDLHVYAATSLGLGTAIAAVFGFIALGDSFLPDNWYSNVTNVISALPILLMLLLALFTLCVGTFITYLRLLFKYYDFTLTRQDQQLITQQGLLQKNTITQPVNRIQAVVFRQNIVRQWFDLTTVETLAATQLDDTSQQADLVALPVAPSQHIWRVMQPFITWIPFIQPVLVPLPPQRDWLFIRNCLLLWLLPVIAVIYFFPQLGWWPLLTLIIAAFQGRYVSRHTKWAQRDDNLILATGSRFTSAVYLIPGRNIQSFIYKQSFFMQHRQLAHIAVHVRRGNSVEAVELRYLPENEAQSLYNWFKNRQQTAL